MGGFTVGAAERGQLLPRHIEDGDILLGLPSSGIHSNGFSLVRHIINIQNLDYSGPCPFKHSARTLGEALLTPTKIYVRACLPLIREGLIKGMAHITGGGFIDNIPRVVPKDLTVALDMSAWELPPVFRWLMKVGNISEQEMARTFNCGIGMVLVVGRDNKEKVMKRLHDANEQVYCIGKLVQKTGDSQSVVLNNMAWQ